MRTSASTLALLAAMATAYGFNISPSFTKKMASLKMTKSYEDQLKSYYPAGDTSGGKTIDVDGDSAAPVNGGIAQYGSPESQLPPNINININGQEGYPPVMSGGAPPSNEVSQSSDGGFNLGLAAVGFIGLPLWFLVSSQVFFNSAAPAPVAVSAPVATVVETPKLTLPIQAATPNGGPAGVVVLSQPISKKEVRGLFNLWNDALQTGDPATVARRYAKDGVLLPTLSDTPRYDFEGIKDYFVHFLEKKPVGKILEGEIYIGNNWAQDAGIYEFTFADGSSVKARYSFVYAFEDGQWMISHHHSSLMPQEVVKPVKVTEQEVRGFFDLWNKALATGDPQKVADRYSKDAVLLPTLSDEARYTNDRIADYFVHFLEKKPTGEILEGNVKIGPNWAQDAGIYEFTFQDGSKTRGRYSYVYTYENGQWLISNHHSSIMPEPAVKAIKKAAEMEKTVTVASSQVDEMEKKMADMDTRFVELNRKFDDVEQKTINLNKAVEVAAPAPVVTPEVVVDKIMDGTQEGKADI